MEYVSVPEQPTTTSRTKTTGSDNVEAQPTHTPDHIRLQREQLDEVDRKLCEKKRALQREEQQLQGQYEQLRRQCTHPREYVRTEYEGGPYGGKTRTCQLCGWSHYRD